MAREVEEFLVRYYSLKVWYNRCIGLLMLPLLIAQFAESIWSQPPAWTVALSDTINPAYAIVGVAVLLWVPDYYKMLWTFLWAWKEGRNKAKGINPRGLDKSAD